MERITNTMQSNLMIFIIISALFLSSCYSGKIRSDTPTSGIAQIAVDESFASIIEEEINVFESLNADAAIIPVYTSERNAYNLLMEDSIRLVIGTRLLTDQEQTVIRERKQRIRSRKIAIDAIALITHQENTDTLLTINDIRNIMSGDIKSWKQINPDSPLDTLDVMFDTPNSGMVRYIQDSLCYKLLFGKNVKAISSDNSSVDIAQVNSHDKVIKYVASHPNSLGFIDLSWISNPVDTAHLSFINNVRIVSVSSATRATPNNSYKPYPFQLALELAHRESPLEFPTGGYPLIRNIYVIITDAFGGLPSGFFSFIAGDRGQRIILKTGILPANRPIRLIQVTEEPKI